MAAVKKERIPHEQVRARGDKQSLSPEAQLLLMSASALPDYPKVRRMLTATFDWQRLYALAAREKAQSVLLRVLDLAGNQSVDPAYRELRQLATFTVARMLQLERVLHDTLDRLARENIDALLLKGAGLGYTSYASFGERPMSDIDLLIRPADAHRAWSLIHRSGWKAIGIPDVGQQYTGHHHLPPLFEPVASCRVEIHQDVLPGEHPFRFSSDSFWQRARRVTVGARTVRVPHPVHQLWHACVHFAWLHEMRWGSWSALRDAAAIASDPQFDWAAFVAFAAETKAETCCYWTLRMARDLANAEVSDAVLVVLRPPYQEWALARLERHFASNLFQLDQRCPSLWLSRRLWTAGIAPTTSGHGSKRPWDVLDRWTSNSSKPPASASGHSALRAARQVQAIAKYLVRLTRVSMPTNLKQIGVSM